MAYRILFSGLMVFVEYHDKVDNEGKYEACNQVNVLLLNPCALHGPGNHHEQPMKKKGKSAGAKGKAADAHGKAAPHNEALCPDHHEPQLIVKSVDIADWQLAGVLQGCGWHHFDLEEKIVFPGLGNDRLVQLAKPPLDEFSVDPFGAMQHVSFRDGIVDIDVVLGKGKGRINPNLHQGDPDSMIVATVRLPPGRLTALAPLANSARSLVGWKVGGQKLESLAEMVMFEPNDPGDLRIAVAPAIAAAQSDFVTLRRNRDVTVWITNEPRRQIRTKGEKLLEAEHFKHYYRLLTTEQVGTMTQIKKGVEEVQGPLPKLQAARNIDNPLCPPCLMHSDTPI